MNRTLGRGFVCLVTVALLIVSAAQASRTPTAGESKAIARAALTWLPGTGWHIGTIRISTVKSRYTFAKAAVANAHRNVSGEMLLRRRSGRWAEVVFNDGGGFCTVAAPRAVLKDLRFACVAKGNERLRVVPSPVLRGRPITLVGSSFRHNSSVWIGVGPPQSEATRIGSARTDARGGFRKTFTVHRSPGRWVALACQRGCRIKAGASFRIIAGGRG